MKKWCLTTSSESFDNYIYFIENETEPTLDELREFLLRNANDRDGDEVFEYVNVCKEIKDFKKL